MATLRELIANMEGWNKPNTLARRNNNPGNLRSGSGQVGTDANGFAIFPNEETGWAALDRQIALDANRGHTLSSFLNKYAPPSENDTTNYLDYVSSNLGVDPDASLLNILSGNSALVNGGGDLNPTNPPALILAGGTGQHQGYLSHHG